MTANAIKTVPLRLSKRLTIAYHATKSAKHAPNIVDRPAHLALVASLSILSCMVTRASMSAFLGITETELQPSAQLVRASVRHVPNSLTGA